MFVQDVVVELEQLAGEGSSAQTAGSSGTQQAGRTRGYQDDETRTATIERVADPLATNSKPFGTRNGRLTIWDAALGRVKAQLDLKQWQIFDLYVLKEWPVREVAQALGVSIGRVYLAKHRVSALVKREIKRIGQTG